VNKYKISTGKNKSLLFCILLLSFFLTIIFYYQFNYNLKKMPPKAPARPAASTAKTAAAPAASTAKTATPAAGIYIYFLFYKL
jgi:uncharacterized protein (UPF0333 family)